MHGIILGGILEREDTSETRNQISSQDEADKPAFWPSIKRTAGGHRIATWLREHDYDVEVIDFWPAWTRDELVELFEQRVTDETIFVGLSAMFPLGGAGKKNQDKVTEIVTNLAHIKSLYPQLTFIGGSQNISATLAYPLDYYVGGFAEYGILELLKHIKGEPNDIKIHKETFWGAERNIVQCRKDYPAWPMPQASIKYQDRDYMRSDEIPTIELGRGCIFSCKFCSFTVLGVKGDHSRCGDSLREELLDNYERWGIRTYTISDETINDSPEKLKKIADVIRSLPFKVHLAGYIRADLLVANPETWQDIWDMGLWSQFYGLESFNHKAAKYVGKGMKPERLKEGLLKVKDWFEAKGAFRCTISMIVGLPYETRETFIDGKNWVMENMPGQSYSYAPLMVADGEMNAMATNPSEFDRTAWTSGIFIKRTHEELGYDINEIPDKHKEIVEFYMNANGVANWEHETMNVWEAWKLFSDIASDPVEMNQLAPGIFYYHRYLTGGHYTLEDMKKTFNEIEPLGARLINTHIEIIEEYKRKKLGK